MLPHLPLLHQRRVVLLVETLLERALQVSTAGIVSSRSERPGLCSIHRRVRWEFSKPGITSRGNLTVVEGPCFSADDVRNLPHQAPVESGCKPQGLREYGAASILVVDTVQGLCHNQSSKSGLLGLHLSNTEQKPLPADACPTCGNLPSKRYLTVRVFL